MSFIEVIYAGPWLQESEPAKSEKTKVKIKEKWTLKKFEGEGTEGKEPVEVIELGETEHAVD